MLYHAKSNTVADYTGTVTGYNSQGSTTTYAATDMVRPVDWNSTHVFNQSLVGNIIAGPTTTSGTDLIYGFTNGVRASFETAASSPNKVTLWFDGGSVFKGWNNAVQLISTSSMTAHSTRWFAQPLQVLNDISFDFVRFPVTFSTSGTDTAATTINTSLTASQAYSYRVALYSRGTGASSQSLMSLSTASMTFSNLRTLTANTTGSQYTISNQYFFGISNTTSSYTTSLARSQTNFGMTTGVGLESVTGPKFLDFPMAGSLAAGQYWIAINYVSTSSAVAGGTALLASRMDMRNYLANQENLNFANFGSTTDTLAKYDSGLGFFTNNGFLSLVPLTSISSTIQHAKLPVTFGIT